MATIYKGEFKVCSPFCSYHPEDVKEILKKIFTKAIKEYRDPETGLGLESFEIGEVVETKNPWKK